MLPKACLESKSICRRVHSLHRVWTNNTSRQIMFYTPQISSSPSSTRSIIIVIKKKIKHHHEHVWTTTRSSRWGKQERSTPTRASRTPPTTKTPYQRLRRRSLSPPSRTSHRRQQSRPRHLPRREQHRRGRTGPAPVQDEQPAGQRRQAERHGAPDVGYGL